MRKLFLLFMIPLLVVMSSCEKEDVHKIKHCTARAIDASSLRVEFDVNLTEEELAGKVHFQILFSAHGDPKEAPLYVEESPWYQEKADLVAGRNHLAFVNNQLTLRSNIRYTGYLRVRLAITITNSSDDIYFREYWSKLVKFEIPPAGDPYVTRYTFSDMSSTGATLVVAWSHNGSFTHELGCVYSTERSDVENCGGIEIRGNGNAYTYVFRDLTPSTTYYVRPWIQVYDGPWWDGADSWRVYSDEILTFTTEK